ncbi:MAG: hypothetical protein AAGA48_13135 [Myxococcota bacterium]
MMRFALVLAVFGTACSSGTETAAPEAPAVEEAEKKGPEVAPVAPVTPDSTGLVPSILETQAALKTSGVDTELATLTKNRAYDLTADAPDRAAVRTGVVLADMLLTVENSEKDRLLAQLGTLRKGMQQLNGGNDIDATLAEYEEQIKTDAISREKLLADFDRISGAVIPELTFNGNERVVPLITAGSWLEGTNLVAQAIKDVPAEKRGDADKLLKAPPVVDYFSQYVADEGADKAPEPVVAQLKTTLGTLSELAKKAEPLTDEELEQVAKATGDVLSLL